MSKTAFELFLDTVEEGDTELLKKAWTAGAAHASDISREEIASLRAQVESCTAAMGAADGAVDSLDKTMLEQHAAITSQVDILEENIRDILERRERKDEALEAAKELIETEQQTLCEPDGTLGTQYESVLALICGALNNN